MEIENTSSPEPAPPKQNVGVKDALAAMQRQIEVARETRLEAQRIAKEKENLNYQKSFEDQFLSDSFSYESYQGAPTEYQGSKAQQETYRNLLLKKSKLKDNEYRNYILAKYGTLQKYFRDEKVSLKGAEYNPETDYVLDVTIITKDEYLKTDHISPDEVIMESLSGVCTFHYVKVNNSTGKTTGTLSSEYIPAENQKWRSTFFSPLANDRVVVWDIVKQKWNSFYMSRLIKFVRDDTSDLE